MLYMMQTYFLKKIQEGNLEAKTQLNLVNLEIKQWFINEAESTILLISAQEIEENEMRNLYHYDIHKKRITKSAILSLESLQGPLNSHKECAKFITKNVSELLENKFQFNE